VIAGVLGAIWVSLQIYSWVTRATADLHMTYSHQIHADPPDIVGQLDRLKNMTSYPATNALLDKLYPRPPPDQDPRDLLIQALEAFTAKLKTENSNLVIKDEHASIYNLADKLFHGSYYTTRQQYFDILAKYLDDIRSPGFENSYPKYTSLILLHVVNLGRKEAKDVSIDIPCPGIAVVNDQEGEQTVQTVKTVLRFPSIRPGRSIDINIWTSAYFRADLDSLAVSYADGTGKVQCAMGWYYLFTHSIFYQAIKVLAGIIGFSIIVTYFMFRFGPKLGIEIFEEKPPTP
jgi:hypothetical protein